MLVFAEKMGPTNIVGWTTGCPGSEEDLQSGNVSGLVGTSASVCLQWDTAGEVAYRHLSLLGVGQVNIFVTNGRLPTLPALSTLRIELKSHALSNMHNDRHTCPLMDRRMCRICVHSRAGRGWHIIYAARNFPIDSLSVGRVSDSLKF